MKQKKRLIWAVMTVFFLVPGLSGANAQNGEQPPARVVTAPVVQRIVAETTKVVGTLYFDRVSNLSTEVGGLVSSVHVSEGDLLKQGAVMFRLNTDFVDNEIETVLAQIDQVKVRLAKAQKDLERYNTLFRQEAVSETEYDNILLSKEELVKQGGILEKQLALARLKQAKCVIRSPFDGLVLEKTVEKGDWVSQGSKLCAIGSINDLFVKVSVSESFLRFAKKGEQVEVSIDSLGKNLTGVIDGFIPVADPQTKSVFVKVRLPLLENPVLNMSATVSMPVSEKKSMILVPRDALVSFTGQDMVFTVTDGKAAPMPVTILAYVGDHVAVDPQGFTAGMPMVVDGNARLRPGQAVTIIN